VRDARSRWLSELRSAEGRISLDDLGDLVAEAAYDEAARSQVPPTGHGHDEWSAVLALVVPAVSASGTTPAWPAPRALRILRPHRAPDASAPSAASIALGAEEIRHWLLAGRDPVSAASAAEHGWRYVRGQAGAAGWSACFAGYAALAGALLGDLAAVELNLERAARARESAVDSFVARGADLGCSWARSLSAVTPCAPAGDPRQREQASRSPLFREAATWLGERGVRLGFDERAPLSSHQERLLRLAADGGTVRQLASRFGVSQRTIEGQLAAIRASLGVTSLQAAIHVALHAGSAAPGASGPAPDRGDGLVTARERAVVELVDRGWSNAAIAQRLGLSVRTVETHLSHAMTKTGTRTRVELAAWWRSGAGDPVDPI